MIIVQNGYKNEAMRLRATFFDITKLEDFLVCHQKLLFIWGAPIILSSSVQNTDTIIGKSRTRKKLQRDKFKAHRMRATMKNIKI